MPITGAVTQFLTSIGVQIPLLAVWLLGAVLAVVFWQRNPRGALLILLACVICLFDVVAFGVIYAVLPQFLPRVMDLGGIGFRTIYSALGLIRSCLIAVAWVLVLVAVFRKNPAA